MLKGWPTAPRLCQTVPPAPSQPTGGVCQRGSEELPGSRSPTHSTREVSSSSIFLLSCPCLVPRGRKESSYYLAELLRQRFLWLSQRMLSSARHSPARAGVQGADLGPAPHFASASKRSQTGAKKGAAGANEVMSENV